MDVGYYRDSESLANFTQDFERLDIADASKGVDTGAIGLAVAPFEDIGNVQPGAYFRHFFGNFKRHLLTFDYAGPGKQKEVDCGAGTKISRYIRIVHIIF